MNEDDVEGRWMKNGMEIKFPLETRFMYTTIRRLHRLTISETFRSDAGEYTFLAGRNKLSMNLLVRCKCRSRSRLDLCVQVKHGVLTLDNYDLDE